MLDTIKKVITGKEEFLESAQVIYEDAVNDIENYITEKDDDKLPDDETPADDTETKGNVADVVEDDDDSDNDGDEGNDRDDTDIMKMDINNPDESTPSASIFDMELTSTETQGDENSDIFDMSIDIKTNTLTDVLPIPPMNAGDAVADNIMDTNIDDGFSEATALAYSDAELQKMTQSNYKGNRSDIGDIKEKLADGEKLTAREAAIFRIHYNSKPNGKHESVGYILMQNFKGNKIPSKVLDAFTESFNEFYDFTEAVEIIGELFSESSDMMKNVVEARAALKELDDEIPGAKKPFIQFIQLIKKIAVLDKANKIDQNSKTVKTIKDSSNKIMSLGDRAKVKELTAPKVVEMITAEVEKIKSCVSSIEEASKTKPVTEAISIDASADDVPPADTTEPVADDKSTTEPNAVTDAVIDKVNDAEAATGDTGNPEDFKTKLMDKLDKLNKGIVDMKENIKKHIS